MATCTRLWLGCHIHRGSVLRVFLLASHLGEVDQAVSFREPNEIPGNIEVLLLSVAILQVNARAFFCWPHTSNIDMQ